jgi:hypothetical protein
MGFDPTRSGPRGDPTLLTCDGENESRRAGGDRAGWMNFNGSGGSLQWCSDHKVRSGAVARWQRRGSAMAAMVRSKYARDRALFI